MRWKTLAKRVAKNMRLLRKRKNLTQETVAYKANVSLRYWQYLEKGERLFTLDALVRVAKALNVDPRDLLS